MDAIEITPQQFARSYAIGADNLAERLAALDERPTPEQIHGLRVAARRLEVVHRLLPKETRNGREARGFNFALRSVRKVTTQVRDFDTLADTLERLGSLLPAGLLVSLQNERSDAAANARSDLALLLPKAPAVEGVGLGKKRLSRRLRRKTRQRRALIESLEERVVSDESRVEELHSLRKETRKLRYLLELSKGSVVELRKLRRWQESLGAIHDLDVAIAYLRGTAWDFPKAPAIRELRRDRREKFLKFVHEQKLGRNMVGKHHETGPLNTTKS